MNPKIRQWERDPVLRANGYHQTELNGYILVYRVIERKGLSRSLCRPSFGNKTDCFAFVFDNY